MKSLELLSEQTQGGGQFIRRQLIKGAVPSIYPEPTEEQVLKKQKEFDSKKSQGIKLPSTARPTLSLIKQSTAQKEKDEIKKNENLEITF